MISRIVVSLPFKTVDIRQDLSNILSKAEAANKQSRELLFYKKCIPQ